MLKFHSEEIRPIAVVGHRASGKTSLVDALLHSSHAVDRLGSVDDGSSVSDYDEEEHKHHFSIDTSVLHVEHGGKFIHLLDAPGYPDFIGASLEALNAVETAIVVISAVNGIEINTAPNVQRSGKARPGAHDRHQQGRCRQRPFRRTRRQHSTRLRKAMRVVQRTGWGRPGLYARDQRSRSAGIGSDRLPHRCSLDARATRRCRCRIR